MTVRVHLVLLLFLFGSIMPGAARADVHSLLQDFTEDFRNDSQASVPVTFGIRVTDAEPSEWHVVVEGRKEGEETATVRLEEGFPPEPSAFFVTDTQTLEKVHDGRMASLTAMGKAFSSDFAPLDLDVMEGFQPDGETLNHLIKLCFHFWTRGNPETVRFGDKSLTRKIHGGNAALFYYQQGFRSGWFLIEKGDHVNEDPRSQVNEFPTLLVITKGTLRCRLGGEEHVLHGGETIYIGAGTAHEFWNDQDEPAEGIILMFGEGA